MTDDRVERNRASASRFGWVPGDFGAPGHGAELVAAVERWQRDRLLPVTGIVDRRTWSSLAGYREGLAERERTKERDANLRGLGSVTRYRADDPRVVRSEVFAGTTVYARITIDDECAAELAARGVTGLGCPVGGRPPKFSGRRLAVYPVPSRGTWTATQRAIQGATSIGAVGLVCVIDEETWAADHHEEGAVLGAVVDEIKKGFTGPLAIASRRRKSGLSEAQRREWRIASRFDAAIPIVPIPVDEGASPDYYTGQAVAEWSIFGQIRPNFQIPAYKPHAQSSENEVHRFRDWLRSRGFRGIGIFGFPPRELWPALFGALPASEEIRRVDW